MGELLWSERCCGGACSERQMIQARPLGASSPSSCRGVEAAASCPPARLMPHAGHPTLTSTPAKSYLNHLLHLPVAPTNVGH